MKCSQKYWWQNRYLWELFVSCPDF